MPAALERAMADLVFGPAFEPHDQAAVEAWLARAEVEADDRKAILDDGVERLLVYRALVRGTLREALECAIPRTMARLGPVFDEYFDRFLRERGPESRYLRLVTREYLDFVEPSWKSDARVPSYMKDLAEHEAVQIEIASRSARPDEQESAELDLDRPVAFIEAARLMRYGHAVHLLPDDTLDRTPPEAGPTALFVYRNPEHEVRYLELSPLAADILERLLAGHALGAALRGASGRTEGPLDPDVLSGTTQLLFDLAERGALLGAAPSEGAR
ncbi:MAG: DUF2063 domain-containing protein [Polyangiaceae bacterium]